jgi:phosphoribosylformimino-5-aminoimidazole carboxamide ribotide isomerase
MLIPSIDLMNGRVVQLVQGETLALESDDLDGWIARFSTYPLVQLIDLDAAMGRGDNSALVRRVCERLPCQVGGGVRTPGRAEELLKEFGARRVVLGSSLFDIDRVRIDRAEAFAEVADLDQLVAAVDSRGGVVTIHGWKTMTAIRAVDAVQALSPYVGRFLYTHVDTEGTMRGLAMEAVQEVAEAAAPRPIIAAGGIRSMEEVERLDGLGIDAVVGMAIYTGAIGGQR